MYTFNPAKLPLIAVAAALALVTGVARAQVWISEILFNPPGSDVPNEYVELRGRPNFTFPPGTYFLAVEGDANGNPGTIQNVFDLSGSQVGGNGFFVLLQNSNVFTLHPDASVLSNTNGSGFGSGAGSSVRHRGEGGQTDLENNSVTFFLIESTNFPVINADIDDDDDGALDGPAFASWTILDSVAVLDNDGAGDFGYGRINFRRTNTTTVASGTIVPVSFTPAYVGRAGNTTNWLPGAWIASGTLDGTLPNWRLDNQDTEPFTYANRLLDHIGGPNFLAPAVAGVVARESNSRTDLMEGSPGTDTYTLSLTVPPAGNVTVQIVAAGQLQVSTDGGASFGAIRSVVLANTSPVSILTRALDDNIVGPQLVPITHVITATGDAAQYPVGSLMPQVKVHVVENDSVLLSELKVNPPGPADSPYEFIELQGAPNTLLTNVFIYVLNGDEEFNPGRITSVIDITGERLGSSGVLLVAADGHPYSVPAGGRVYLAPELDPPEGALGNGSVTFLLVSCPAPNPPGFDLDGGDKGILEGMPLGATILDSVAWLDGGDNDQIHSPAALTQADGTPDAATRIPGNTTANSAAAWVNGNLEGANGDSLVYGAGGSSNLGYGTLLTPGSINDIAPQIFGLAPFSAVIGDPTTPVLTFQIFDAQTPADQLVVTVTSSDEAIVPNANLILSGSGATRTLAINPVGVGYANILVTVSDGTMTGLGLIPFAASVDLRGGGRFHTGVSDASAAMAIDREYMFVGDDENQVLRVYSRSNSGPAIVLFDMNPFLGLVDFYGNGLPREIDVEGSTRVGNRIYWIGSHSHSQDADIRTNRARIFATDVSGSGTNATLTFAGRYEYLKLDLMNWDATNGHGKGSNYYGLVASGDPGADPKALDGSGFNIEGLAMAPGSTNTAFLCFRAPMIPTTNRVKALLVPVTNFAAVAVSTAPGPGMARFGEPMELNLGGRAFRSVEGNSNGYLIVAGPPGVASGAPPSDFRLFTWTGFASNPPQELGAALAHLLPEGMVELPPAPWTSNSTVQLISDSGITVYYNDGIEAKHLPIRQHKKFRSDWVTLGPVVVSQPVIKSVVHTATDCTLTWYSVAGLSYQVQYKLSLSDASWTGVPGNVLASDALASKVIAIPAGGQRFFRVVVSQ